MLFFLLIVLLYKKYDWLIMKKEKLKFYGDEILFVKE